MSSLVNYHHLGSSRIVFAAAAASPLNILLLLLIAIITITINCNSILPMSKNNFVQLYSGRGNWSSGGSGCAWLNSTYYQCNGTASWTGD